MEEFWKDIFMASFHDQRSHYFSTATHYASRAIILHDFLAVPFAGDNPSPPVSAPPSKSTASSFLSLSSGSDFQPSGSFRSNPQLLSRKGARDSSTDQKRERLIKNRDSAARSRAKKHAYINELELEVARLQEENAELRRQQQKMCFAGNTHLPKNKKLQRTLTAPF